MTNSSKADMHAHNTGPGSPSATPGPRGFRTVIAMALTALVGVAGAILVPSAANAADTGAISALGPISVTQTGSDPLPPEDPSLTDNIVAAGDTVKWSVPYTVATPGSITLTATLPATASFDAATVSLCEAGSSVSADGRTATCVITPTTTGAGSWNLAALASGANDGTVALTVTASGLEATSPTTVVKGTPRVNLTTAGNRVFSTTMDGVQGTAVSLSIGGYIPIDPTTGLKGREPLADTFSFEVDVSQLPPNAQVQSCNGDVDAGLPKSSGGGTNGVTDSGTWTCTQPGGPGTPITVTVTGADTTALRYPTRTIGGALIPADRAYVFTHSIYIFVPGADTPAGSNVFPVQITGFDPESLSGQSNWGDGYAPGQAPGSPLIVNTNGSTYTIDNSTGGGFSQTTYWTKPDGSALLGWPNNFTSGGNYPLYPGESFTLRAMYGNQSPVGASRTDTFGCQTWDPAKMTISGSVTPIPATRQVLTEYGTATGGTPSSNTSKCGTYGDGAADWYPTLAAAQAAGTVSMVRYSAPEPIAPAMNSIAVLGIPMTRTLATLPNSTQIPTAQTDTAAQLTAPHTYTVNAIAADSQLTNTISAADVNVAPAGTTTVTVQPTVVNTFAPGIPASASDVVETITLPSTATYVAGSASIAPTSVTVDGAGTTTLVFPVGSITSDTATPPITFQVQASTNVVMPQNVGLTSVISSSGNIDSLAARTATGSFTINAPQQFGFAKSVSATAIEPGDPLTYTLADFNTLANPVGPYTAVDVLPYNGDTNGTTGLTSFRVASLDATDSLTVFYTTDAPAGVRSAVQSDIATTSVNWTPYAGGDLPAGVTAIKVTTPSIAPNQVDSIQITLDEIEASNQAVLGNSYTALYAQNGTTVPVADAAKVKTTFSSSSLSGVVYQDNDFSGALTLGDTPLAGQTVTLSGYAFGPTGTDQGGAGSNVPVAPGVTAVTDAAGVYTFPGLASGVYTVTMAPPAGTLGNGDTVSSVGVASATAVAGENLGFYSSSAVPVAHDDAASIPETGATSVDVLANDTGANIALDAANPPTTTGGASAAYVGRKLQVTPGGHTWAEGETSYTATVSYHIVGVFGQTSSANAAITVLRAPQLIDDSARTGFGVPVTLDVLANDTGSDLVLDSVGTSAGGTTAIDPDGTITFTPALGFTGDASFAYTAKDSVGQTASANVTVTVVALPVAVADAAKTGAGAPVTVDALANDSGSGLSVTSVGTTADGVAAINADGTITFTPAAGFSGDASFTYTVTDEVGQAATATVTVTVIAAPVATDDAAQTGVDIPVTVDVLANDSGTGLTVTAVGSSTNGAATINADGTVTFTPAAGFDGVTSFTYTVTDEVGQTATATVTVTVLAGPVAVDDLAKTGVDTAVTIPVLANDAGTELTVTAVGTSADGVATINADGTVTFTPAAGFTGTASFTYTVADALGRTSTGTVQVIVQAKPTIADATARTGEGTAVELDVLSSATGSGLSVTLGSVTNGTASVGSNGVITFTPAAGFSGDATFGYTVTDEVGQTATATATVTVVAAPRPADDSARTGEGRSVTLDVLANDGGDGLTILSVGTSPDGTVTIEPTAFDLGANSGSLTFTPDAGFVGTATFSYTVVDSVGQQATAQVAIEVVAAPVANGDEASTMAGTAVTIDVLANDTGEDLTVTAAGTSADGTTEVNPDGTITFVPEAAFVGDAEFDYTITDGLGQQATGAVVVHVLPEPASPAPGAPGAGSGDSNGLAPSDSHPNGSLPSTGSSIAAGAIALTALLLLLGVVLVVRSRRRGRAQNTDA